MTPKQLQNMVDELREEATRAIPDHMVEGVVSYVERGVPNGGFLTAVFENDFILACTKADQDNVKRLRAYALLVYNHTPHGCHGSGATVAKWMKGGGLRGLFSDAEAPS